MKILKIAILIAASNALSMCLFLRLKSMDDATRLQFSELRRSDIKHDKYENDQPYIISDAKRLSWKPSDDRRPLYLSGYSSPSDGREGAFFIDKNDHASVDDDGTVFVAVDGTRIKRVWNGDVNVHWFGASGDGHSNDSEAILKAWKFCVSRPAQPGSKTAYAGSEIGGPALYFPSGNYVFKGGSLGFPLSSRVFAVRGDGANRTRIQVLNDDYFINVSDLSGCEISGIQFFGGKGTLKVSNDGTNVRGTYLIHDCSFLEYSECAIGHTSSDMPAWRVENNVFFGSDGWASIGVALSGLTDNSSIRANQFQRNHYGIKIRGGYNAYITNNDFIRYTKPNKDVADIWIVPVAGPANQGLVISGNKFGNENLRESDFRILVAAESPSAGSFLSRAHSEADESSEMRLGLLEIRDNNFVGADGYKRGVISSYSSDIRYLDSKNMFSGAYPKAMVDFPTQFIQSRLNSSNIHDVSQFYDATEALIPPFSTSPVGLAKDPWSYGAGLDSFVQYFTSGQDPSYTPLLDAGKSLHDQLSGPVEKLEELDATGRPGAVSLRWNSPQSYAQASFSVGVANKPVWLEFDIKQRSLNSFESVVIDIRPKEGSESAFRRKIRIPRDWQRVRFIWFPAKAGDYRVLFPENLEPFKDGQSEGMVMGNLHIYQAHEPVSNGLLRSTALVLDPGSPPRREAGKSIIYLDAEDGALKIMANDGTTKTVVTKP